MSLLPWSEKGGWWGVREWSENWNSLISKALKKNNTNFQDIAGKQNPFSFVHFCLRFCMLSLNVAKAPLFFFHPSLGKGAQHWWGQALLRAPSTLLRATRKWVPVPAGEPGLWTSPFHLSCALPAPCSEVLCCGQHRQDTGCINSFLPPEAAIFFFLNSATRVFEWRTWVSPTYHRCLHIIRCFQ